jgi:hypothetical protein
MEGSRDFDFVIGGWKVRNSRLLRRLEGCTEWEQFDALSHARSLPGGIGNIDEFHAGSWRPGFVGVTMRIFNPQSGLWSIYWTDNGRFTLDPPVVGRFRDGVGIFEGDDQHEGTPVRVRFHWTNPTPETARWEQAFSVDRENWETNWVMEMSRVSR